jgi:flagella basal body P-ring formation protein FlgA
VTAATTRFHGEIIMKRLLRLTGICAAILLTIQPPHAQIMQRQDAAAIHRGVENFLRIQTAGSPNKVSYTIAATDPRVFLPACPALEFFLPAGARLWGQTAVGVRCTGETPWNIYVTVQVTVTGNYAVLARALPQGHTLTASDLALQSGDLTQLPAGIVGEPGQAVGKVLAAALAAGQPLRQDSLRSIAAVQQGQTVLLQSSGNGFRVTAEGKALNNAQDGQIAQVRTASGQTVSGIARASGIVEVIR